MHRRNTIPIIHHVKGRSRSRVASESQRSQVLVVLLFVTHRARILKAYTFRYVHGGTIALGSRSFWRIKPPEGRDTNGECVFRLSPQLYAFNAFATTKWCPMLPT